MAPLPLSDLKDLFSGDNLGAVWDTIPLESQAQSQFHGKLCVAFFCSGNGCPVK
jgi:hypothetical protein